MRTNTGLVSLNIGTATSSGSLVEYNKIDQKTEKEIECCLQKNGAVIVPEVYAPW